MNGLVDAKRGSCEDCQHTTHERRAEGATTGDATAAPSHCLLGANQNQLLIAENRREIE